MTKFSLKDLIEQEVRNFKNKKEDAKRFVYL